MTTLDWSGRFVGRYSKEVLAQTMRFVRAASLSLVMIGLLAFGTLVCFQAISCPLCEGVGNTISDDVKSPAVGVIAVCQRCTEIADGQYEIEIDPKSVVPVGRGPNAPTPQIDRLLVFEAIPPKTSVFLIGVPDDCERDQSKVSEKKPVSWIWTAPSAVSTMGREYLQGLPTEATSEVQRLIYFYSHLFSTDSFVNEDAYNECARVSLLVMRDPDFQKTIDRESLVEALRGSAMNPKHKSFLWMVLAEWGKESDQELFRELVTPILKRELGSVEDERVSVDLAKDHPWMAASIAAFIKLGKEPALREIEEFIFANPKCSMSMKSTGINAARVLGNDLRAMETQRLARSLAMMIQDSECADLVIPDLARWDYWDAMPELVRLFDRPESARGFVRTPIMNYLRRCPLPQADQHLKRMRSEDPTAYRRALTNVPVLEKAPVLTP